MYFGNILQRKGTYFILKEEMMNKKSDKIDIKLYIK